MLEQRRHKKRMRHQLDRADIAIVIPAGHPQIAAFQLTGKRVRNTIVTVIAFRNDRLTIGFGDQRIGAQFNCIRFSTSEQVSGIITIRPSVSVSACAASCQPSTLRAYSTIAC